jgi:hypothetical protein
MEVIVKKLILILLLFSNFLYSSAHCMAKQDRDKQQSSNPSILPYVLQAYGISQGNNLVHEIGHLAAGKALYNMRGLIHVSLNPLGQTGCYFYNGPRLPLYSPYLWETANIIGEAATSKLFKNQEKLLEQITHPHVTGKKGAVIAAAGPMTGMLYCLGIPVLTTLYHEYCKHGSLNDAWKNTKEKSYLNEENQQSMGILLGALFGFGNNYMSLLPIKKGTDGYQLLEFLQVNVPRVRTPILTFGLGAPILAAGKFCMDYFFKDSNNSK